MSLSFGLFLSCWWFSFGFRPGFLPSRPHFRVCVSVAVFVDRIHTVQALRRHFVSWLPPVQLPVVMAAAAFTAALQNALAASGGVPLHAAGDTAVIAASKGIKALREERRRTRRIGG